MITNGVANVLDFGALPIREHDSLPAFLAARDALRAHGGGTLYMPYVSGVGGHYSFQGWEHKARNLLLEFGDLELAGDGHEATTLSIDAAAGTSSRGFAISPRQGGQPIRDVLFRDFFLDYQREYSSNKQAHGIFVYGAGPVIDPDTGEMIAPPVQVQNVSCERMRFRSGSGDGIYYGAHTQVGDVTDCLFDCRRGWVTIAGDAIPDFRVGFRFDRLGRAPDFWSVYPEDYHRGVHTAINFERGGTANNPHSGPDTFWGVEISNIDAPQGGCSLANGIGTRLRDSTLRMIYFTNAVVTVEDCDLRGTVTEQSSSLGSGFTLVSSGYGDLQLFRSRIAAPVGGRGLVYMRTTAEGPRRVHGYDCELVMPEGTTLHHPDIWKGSRWFETVEVTPCDC